MSQYVDFFIKDNDKFIYLNSFSRNHQIYKAICDYAPWEKVRPLTESVCGNIIDSLIETKHNYETLIAKETRRKELVATFNNSIDDKMELISAIDEGIAEYTEAKEMADNAISIYTFFSEMIDSKRWDYGEDNNYATKEEAIEASNKYIYVGMEVGRKITTDMIEED